MKRDSRTIFLYAGSAIVLCLCAAATALYFLAPQEQEAIAAFDAGKVLDGLDTENEINDYLEIEQMIGEAMETYGTRAAFEIIDEGERRDIISNDQCHGFLHFVGHTAFAEHPNDYDALLKVVEGTNCIGGYLHGIEAEIVLTSPNVVKDVSNFCIYQKEKGVNPGPCFHGVGHAGSEFYNYDIPKALELCDALAGGPEDDLTNCYRGVFSEVGNIATGYDGHTGLAIDTIEIDGLDTEKPYAYCNTFAQRHQSSCKSQLLKIILNGVDKEKWLETCKNEDFDHHTKQICVNIASGVYVRSELSFKDSVTLPAVINSFPEDLRKISMLGSLEAYTGYFSDNLQREWKPFCDAYTAESDVRTCYELFEDTITNGTAPWMEYDIR